MSQDNGKQPAVKVKINPRPGEFKELHLQVWQVQAAYRLAQIAKEPGVYHFRLRATEDGRKILNLVKDED